MAAPVSEEAISNLDMVIALAVEARRAGRPDADEKRARAFAFADDLIARGRLTTRFAAISLSVGFNVPEAELVEQLEARQRARQA